MKSAKLLLLITTFIISHNIVHAQNARSMRRLDAWSSQRSDGEQRLSAGLNLGTTGIGIELRAYANKILNLRFGGNFWAYTYTHSFSNGSGTADISFSNIHLLGEFKLSQELRLVGGLAYFYQNEISAQGKLIDGAHYGDIDIKTNEVNDTKVLISWKKICPYVGISVLPAFPSGRFNVNFDLGTYYMSMPESTWETKSEEAQFHAIQYKKTLDQYISGYRWYPVLQMHVNYLLK